jgi:Arc/MetJ-type ribon-helix-helix transcriptional regulator
VEVTLPSELEHWVIAEVAAGRFASVNDAVAEAVRLLADDADAPPSPRSAADIIASLDASDDDIRHGRTMRSSEFLASLDARVAAYLVGRRGPVIG